MRGAAIPPTALGGSLAPGFDPSSKDPSSQNACALPEAKRASIASNTKRGERKKSGNAQADGANSASPAPRRTKTRGRLERYRAQRLMPNP